jgi:hypothetical protein
VARAIASNNEIARPDRQRLSGFARTARHSVNCRIPSAAICAMMVPDFSGRPRAFSIARVADAIENANLLFSVVSIFEAISK